MEINEHLVLRNQVKEKNINNSMNVDTMDNGSRTNQPSLNCGPSDRTVRLEAVNLPDSPSAPQSSISKSKESNCKSGTRKCSNKGFHSFDSLRFERERLNTYIDWPLHWLSPNSLAKEGLYYLREKDHVSCVFCRGIMGSWQPGDIPRNEHKRHFKYCAFVKGQPVGNVPLVLGDLIASLQIPVYKGATDPKEPVPLNKEFDPKTASKANPIPGLPVHSQPKRYEFVTYENRLKTYRNWPTEVKQDPKKLADAGFFYCGLSDHVRCYHCGQGLRNWEETDDPWVEHARWYPDCDFVRITKTTEFIEKVRVENPPYNMIQSEQNVQVNANQPSTSGNNTNALSAAALAACSSRCANPLQRNKTISMSEKQLDSLMELDIMKAALKMDFPVTAVRKTLKTRIETTGMPFFNLEHCIEQVIMATDAMELDDEVEQSQESKIRRFSNSATTNEGTESMSNAEPFAASPDRTSTPVNGDSTNEESSQTREVASNGDVIEFPLNRMTSLNSQTSETGSTSSVDEAMDTRSNVTSEDVNSSLETPPLTHYSSLPPVFSTYSASSSSSSGIGSSISSRTSRQSSASSSDDDMVVSVVENVPTMGYTAASTLSDDSYEIISQVNKVISQAQMETMKISSPPKKKSKDALSSSEENPSVERNFSDDSANSSLSSESDSETNKDSLNDATNKVALLEKEVEVLKDQRMCRVCMDQEMTLVFLPCLHMATCATCGVALKDCPICRAEIVHIIRPNIVA